MLPAQSMLVIANGSTSWLPNGASLGRITCCSACSISRMKVILPGAAADNRQNSLRNR